MCRRPARLREYRESIPESISGVTVNGARSRQAHNQQTHNREAHNRDDTIQPQNSDGIACDTPIIKARADHFSNQAVLHVQACIQPKRAVPPCCRLYSIVTNSRTHDLASRPCAAGADGGRVGGAGGRIGRTCACVVNGTASVSAHVQCWGRTLRDQIERP